VYPSNGVCVSTTNARDVQRAVQLARGAANLRRGRRLEPELLRRARQVPERRRRPLGRRAHADRPRGRVGAHAAVVGRRLEVQRRVGVAGALVHPPDLQLRQAARRQQRHPRRVEARHRLPVSGQLLTIHIGIEPFHHNLITLHMFDACV
jgi:hypothetical protein